MAATHIALLRGINVGKAKRIAMADLKAVVESLGGTAVKTLLNSGNVVFTTRRAITGAKLRAAILSATGVDSKTTLLTTSEFRLVMRENQLLDVAHDHSRLVAYIPADASVLPPLAALLAVPWAPEVIAIGSRAAYVWSPDGLLAGKLFEHINRIIRDDVTARNWATMLKIEAALTAG
jgi:uncharacterized protein (DUF1697 family)